MAEAEGLTITTLGNSLVRPIEKSAVYILNPSVSKEIVDILAKFCHTEPTTELPDWLKKAMTAAATNPEKPSPYKVNTDLLVVLGNDFKTE